ncbi:MAG: hypothetical protein EBS13_09755, partial [Verrucomicrobia bacterium]|nr:hypothetical protein [Verrucomicrobiota bacterium]
TAGDEIVFDNDNLLHAVRQGFALPEIIPLCIHPIVSYKGIRALMEIKDLYNQSPGKQDVKIFFQAGLEATACYLNHHPSVQDLMRDEKGTIDQADQVVDRWEQVKAEEKKQKGISNENPSIFKKLPPRLPALLFANDIYKRAEKADVDDRLSLDKGKIDSMAQNMDQEKAGRALFELVAACRKSGLDPEACLRDFASKQMQEAEDTPA